MLKQRLVKLRLAMKENESFKYYCNVLLGDNGYYSEHPENKQQLYKDIKYILINNDDNEFEKEFDNYFN